MCGLVLRVEWERGLSRPASGRGIGWRRGIRGPAVIPGGGIKDRQWSLNCMGGSVCDFGSNLLGQLTLVKVVRCGYVEETKGLDA